MEKCHVREKLFVKMLLEKKELNIDTASENLCEMKPLSNIISTPLSTHAEVYHL